MNVVEPSSNRNIKRISRRLFDNNPNRRVEPTEMPEYVENFDRIMTKVMILTEDTKNEFKKILTENGCLIAGGSVLSASQSSSGVVNDFDIYVPIDTSKAFFDQFAPFLFKLYNTKIKGKIGVIKYNSFTSSFYCNSFLRRNGIKKVHRFNVRSYEEYSVSDVTFISSFDIMIIRKEKKPIDVVNNFDLTFCQIWYDGKTIWASHPEDVRSKKGKLQGDYRKLFITGNSFIQSRVKKYVERGYEVALDEFTGDEIKNSLTFNREICPSTSTDLLSSWRDREFQSKWAIRALKKSFLGDNYLSMIDYKYNDKRSRTLYPFKSKLWDFNDRTETISPNTFVIKEDDGYDTDEYSKNESLLVALADKKYEVTQDAIDLSTNLTPELKFHRMANQVLEDAIYPFENDDKEPSYNFSSLYYGRVNPNTGEARLIHGYELSEVCSKYYSALSNYSLRIASEDYLFAEEGDRVFDLHHHPIEGAINQENLEAHLKSNSEVVNKNRIPCYWTPEPGDSPKNCKEFLTLKQIFYCVNYKFFFKFKKLKGREDPSLLLNIPKYDQILYDTKESEPQDNSWPNLYHQGVCPFCLESVTRGAGCIYMTHPNPQGLPDSESPFCNPALVNKRMLDFYRKKGREIDPNYIPNVQDHLEFCIECGRPSYNHKHFSFENFYELLNQGGAAVCNGGGRVEMFARVLAIRKSFKDAPTDNLDYRIDASEAASDAPIDRELMAEAARKYASITQIAEGRDREWGNGLQITGGKRSKRYRRTRKLRKL